MDNVIIADGVIALILLAGALIGAKRGLIKSLAGLAVLIVALLVSVKLADMLTEPVTDAAVPKIEQALVKSFTEALEDKDGDSRLTELMKSLGFPEETVDSLLAPLAYVAQGMTEASKQSALDRFHKGLSDCIRPIVRGTVHTVLLLVSYLIVTLLLKLAIGALDLMFELPGLSAVNAIAGALFGFMEAALIVCAFAFAVTSLNIKGLEGVAGGTRLLDLFVKFNPFD